MGTSSAVLYSHLTSDTVDAVIQAQVGYFTSLGHDFEWKTYAHDQPPDLVERLAAHGFAIEETEAILFLDLRATLPAHEVSMRIRKITRPDELRDIASVRKRVYPDRATNHEERLAFELERTPDGISIYVAYVDDAPAASGWIRFPQSGAFASMWGGSTIPELRGRGLYSELVGVRAREARDRGFRYLTVDARSMSRPILEKQGFQLLTFSTPCTWSASPPEN